ncbi:hypothetical protein NQ317_015457 [Molorchus minor]|uniref:Uncharacterized protein n=1 Tax=Molorchus minor TaxID=1323400 RepID=A0ABQ9JUP6_9CUCU|nr:hypothetical protein NQ317_015457 [Molorchus minor]
MKSSLSNFSLETFEYQQLASKSILYLTYYSRVGLGLRRLERSTNLLILAFTPRFTLYFSLLDWGSSQRYLRYYPIFYQAADVTIAHIT